MVGMIQRHMSEHMTGSVLGSQAQQGTGTETSLSSILVGGDRQGTCKLKNVHSRQDLVPRAPR